MGPDRNVCDLILLSISKTPLIAKKSPTSIHLLAIMYKTRHARIPYAHAAAYTNIYPFYNQGPNRTYFLKHKKIGRALRPAFCRILITPLLSRRRCLSCQARPGPSPIRSLSAHSGNPHIPAAPAYCLSRGPRYYIPEPAP